MSICISTHCKKYSTCKKAHPNDGKMHQAINWHDSGSFASGAPSFVNGEVVYSNPIEYHDCGEKGFYKMYEPITQNNTIIQDVVITWNDCNTSRPLTTSENNKAIVLYSIATSANTKKLYDWTEARWNGIEWRTDDFGLTDKENLFDNPKYKPVAWAEVKIPEEFKVYKN